MVENRQKDTQMRPGTTKRTQTLATCNFPWQEKLVAPLIANLIGYSQCKDRVTKSEGKKTAAGYISDLFASVRKIETLVSVGVGVGVRRCRCVP